MSARSTIPNLTLAGFTRREADVLLWITRGKSNLEIGTILDISPRTVKKHLEHIYRKLGVKSRLAAAVRTSAMMRARRVGVR